MGTRGDRYLPTDNPVYGTSRSGRLNSREDQEGEGVAISPSQQSLMGLWHEEHSSCPLTLTVL